LPVLRECKHRDLTGGSAVRDEDSHVVLPRTKF
jgi:hypothetical protein